MKKLIALLLAMVLLTALVPFGAMAEEMTTIKVLAKTWTPYNPEETSIWDELAARTGVKIDFIWTPNTNYEEKVNTVLASGDLPDAIMGANISLLLNQGAIIPLDDLLAEKCPNYLALLKPEDDPWLRNPDDGQMYYLSHIMDFPPAMSFLYRADWAKDAGMDAPETWADWMAYWEWVRDNDANGNGDPSDEIPLVENNTDNVLMLANWFDMKVMNNYFAMDNDGNLVPLFEHPNFKTYLETMISLYNNGILDKEFATRSDTYKSVLDTAVAASSYYFAERANLTTAVLRDSGDEDAAFLGIAPPTYYDGGSRNIKSRARVESTGLAITVAAEERGTVDAILKLWNYIYSPEGSDLMNYGIEGRHHTKVDGKYVYTEEVLSGAFTTARKSGVIPSVVVFGWTGDSYMQILTGGKSYEELTPNMQYFYDALFMNEPYFYSVVPMFNTASYVEYGAELTSKLTSIFARTVVGELSVDQFYAEYDNIKNEGWQDVIDEQIAAYTKLK